MLDLGVEPVPPRAQNCYLVGRGHGCQEASSLLTLKQENDINYQLKGPLVATPISVFHWTSALLLLDFRVCLLMSEQLYHCC